MRLAGVRGVALAVVLLAPTSPGGPAAAPGGGRADEASALDGRETAALRTAAWRVNTLDLEIDEAAALLREAVIADPGLPDRSRQRLADRLARDLATRQRLHELLAFRRLGRCRPAQVFAFWWRPGQLSADGLPSRAPTHDEVAELEALAKRVAERYGVDLPAQAPYRIDPSAPSSRVFPRSDLRWGVVSPSPADRRAVVSLVLLELGDLPFVAGPLAALEADCGDRPECRAALLDRARRTAVDAGYVPVLEALKAGALASPDDPAFASGALLLAHLEQRLPPRALAALIRELRPDASTADARRVIAGATGESPRRLDREVLRELSGWAHLRDPGGAPPPPRRPDALR